MDLVDHIPTMIGLFVARISRGDTIKELIVNGVAWGSEGCWAFFATWGDYVIDLDVNKGAYLQAVLSEVGVPATVVAVLNTIPGSVLVLFTLLCFVFLATTVDSSAYMLASICTKEISVTKSLHAGTVSYAPCYLHWLMLVIASRRPKNGTNFHCSRVLDIHGYCSL